MDNYTIAEHFSLLSKLMDINGENAFKSKTYSIAAFTIEKLPVQLADTPRDKISGIKGMGESVAKKVIELLDTGSLSVLTDYISQTPPGVIEMLNIKGIGPKKIHTIWKEMGIESIGELLYACDENRLTLYKGFGEKTQQNVRESIDFYLQNQGNFLYAQVDELFPQIQQYMDILFGRNNAVVTGAYRRQDLIIEELEFVVAAAPDIIKPKFITAQPPELLEETEDSILYKLKNGLRLRIYAAPAAFQEKLFTTTGSTDFTEAFLAANPSVMFTQEHTDESVFEKADLPFVPACLRNTAGILEEARKGSLPQLIQSNDIRGIIHSHSNWSDGVNTIEEMARECMRRGLEYLVISDHSKAAAYANGLTEERIREQHRYIDQLNAAFSAEASAKQQPAFRIFKSIECDILNDGSMDYSDDILATFDLVIASVHSNLKMPQDKAMMRLLKAIENPYTRILGHMTGRLLLSRNGYPVDHKAIIEACAARGVVIELNAHPRRLDIDWEWIPLAVEKGVLISINPDAHELSGFDDVKYGVLAGQKGGLSKEHNLSSFPLTDFETWLTQQ